jgi:hypothetical protein
MAARPLEPDTILIGTPLPNGTMVLVPRFARARSCHRLDGTAKIAFETRSDARKSCRKHEHVYGCKFCGAWHLATTKVKPKVVAPAPPFTRKAA